MSDVKILMGCYSKATVNMLSRISFSLEYDVYNELLK